MEYAIVVEDIHKSYGNVKAVNGITFRVKKGELFVMVGPNGAGKTTTIEICEGLRELDEGKVSILGKDPTDMELKKHIGVQLQEGGFPEMIKVEEILELFSSLYSNPAEPDYVLKELGLIDKKKEYYSKLSGGLKQRVAIAAALVVNPDILFLDELTTGLDPQARRSTWKFIKEIKKLGKTIFLTTHYMEEAEVLGDRIMIIDQGEIVALDTPTNLIRQYGGISKVTYMGKPIELKTSKKIEQVGEEITVYTDDVEKTLTEITQKSPGVLKNIRIEKPNLEDVYISLTGKEIK